MTRILQVRMRLQDLRGAILTGYQMIWCMGKQQVSWHSSPPQAPSAVIDLSNSPSDTESGLVSQCPWCDLRCLQIFEPFGYTVGTPQDLMKVLHPDPMPSFNPDHHKVANASLFMPHCECHRLETISGYCSARWVAKGILTSVTFQIMSENCKELLALFSSLMNEQKHEFFKSLQGSFVPGNQSCCSIQHELLLMLHFNGNNAG